MSYPCDSTYVQHNKRVNLLSKYACGVIIRSSFRWPPLNGGSPTASPEIIAKTAQQKSGKSSRHFADFRKWRAILPHLERCLKANTRMHSQRGFQFLAGNLIKVPLHLAHPTPTTRDSSSKTMLVCLQFPNWPRPQVRNDRPYSNIVQNDCYISTSPIQAERALCELQELLEIDKILI